jgi:signal transduction histidine kinase
MAPHLLGFARYGLALGTVAAAFGARYLLEPILGEVAPLMLFILSIMLSAWYGGLGPGLLATAASGVIGDYFFIEPLYTFEFTGRNLARQVEWGLFMVIGALISMLNQARISSEKRRLRHLLLEQEARAAAEAANRHKDEFLATISHELRSPINSILGWGVLLCKGKLNREKTDQVSETIVRNAKVQLRLIEDLLDASKLVSGNLRLVSEPTRLTPVIEAAADVVRPLADDKGVQLSLTLDPTKDRVMGDATRLQQVVWNLLTNAVKFTPPGGNIDVRLNHSGSQAQITVSDTGKGISRDFLPYVFDRFRQANCKSGGVGLGMAIARSLVELHGGRIEADSAGEGHGATFRVCLPLEGT